ncbi:MAG: winged helix-turn-helix domain-containing protein [Anaerolineae bacterium]|nr:winged helix-turn-helix domain-containing protein [Anaerolineae bacterium]
MTAKLIVVRGDLNCDKIPLDHTPLRLGRDSAQNDVALPASDKRISRQHLEVIEEFGRWVLVDHSRNGVLVNDVLLCNDRHALQHGDRIGIGASVELRFDDPNSTSAMMPPLQTEGVVLDAETLAVWRDGVYIDVEWSPQEFALLRFLDQRRGHLCTYDEIVAAIWGSADPTYGRGHVHELVARVRRKLEPDPAQPIYLMTRPGHGYLLV